MSPYVNMYIYISCIIEARKWRKCNVATHVAHIKKQFYGPNYFYGGFSGCYQGATQDILIYY